MKFQLTCFVDETLIGSLTELIAPYSRVIVKLVEDGEPTKPLAVKARIAPASALLPRKNSGISPEKGLGALLGLRVVAIGGPQINATLKAEFKKAGLAPDGAGATLSKLRSRGYLRHGAKGEWSLSAKGEAAVRRFSATPVKTIVHDEAEVLAHDNADH